MRKTLFAAVALAPLCFLVCQTAAVAQTTISNTTTTPVTTAADGDITLTGTISPTTGNTAAVTVNSSAATSGADVFQSTGTITYKDLNNVVGVAIQGGNTGTVSNAGSISVSESFTTSDTNKDGVNEAPFASATSAGRYGIQLTGTQPFTGDIINTGTIVVQGNKSAGISLDGPLQGNLTDSGTIAITGDNSAGLRESAGVSGNVTISGAITAIGAGVATAATSTTPAYSPTSGVVLSGPVGGRVSLYAAVSSTDYGLTTRTTTPSSLATIQSTLSEVNPLAGSAVIINGSVAGGIFLASPPPNTNATDSVTDADGDGVVDNAEVASSITTFGSAPALVISGSAGNNITIGGFTAATSSNLNNGFGLIVEGTISGSGVYDAVPATALQIGGGGGTTTFTSAAALPAGVLVTGSVTASAFGASATAIHIGSGATVPTLENSGVISAAAAAPNTTNNVIPSYTGTATGLQIDAGASVSSLINSGSISASVTGHGTTIAAIGVADAGGGITSVVNSGTISVSLTSDTTAAATNGALITLANGTTSSSGTVALDLSANKTGVTLTQQQAPTQVVTTTTVNSVSTSVTTTTSAATLAPSTAATTTTTTNGDVTTTTTVPASPAIVGDIYLGSGSNTVNLLAGTVSGALGLGSGPTASLTIDNGAVYVGALTYTGAALALNVNNGTLQNLSPSASTVAGVAAAYKLSSLNVGATGVVFFDVDPANNRASEFLVSGGATIATGAKFGLTFTSNAVKTETFTLVSASSLTIGEADTALNGAVPYIFNASIQSNAAAGTITATISPKSAAQLGLNPSQAAALPATYQALTLDGPVQTAFLDQFTKAGFLGLYNQLLPDYAGGTFQAANATSLAISRATAESNDIENPTGSRGAWMQEIFVGVNQGAGQTDGFRGGGFGFVGGVETGGSGLGAFGLTSAFVSTSISDPHLPGDSQTSLSELEFGGYWQGEFSGFTADARLGVGYTWMGGRREVVQTDSNGDITLDRKVKSDWNGYTLSGRAGLAYKWIFNSHVLGGGWFIEPQTHIDYFMLNENAYTESTTGISGTALPLAFQGRTGQETSGTASILFGRKLGTGLVWRPEVELGVRDVFSGNAGDTTAKFVSGGPSFTLTPADITGTAGIARFKLKASSEYYELGIEAGGEILSSRYEEGDVKASIRVLF